MTYEKDSELPSSRGIGMLKRLGRFSAFFATAGFAFPNVFVENVDIAKLDARNKIKTENR